MTAFKKHSKIGGLRLQRREGQTIIVNHGELVIEVTEIRNKAVKLSFQASKEISIRRGEISPPEQP